MTTVARWKGHTPDLCRSFLKPGHRAIDVGAGRGEEAQAMAEAVGPTGHVYMIEPDTRCAKSLRELHERYPQVQHIEAVAGQTRGYRTFYEACESDHSACWEVLAARVPDGTDPWTSPRRSVCSVALDDVASSADLVKIDVQGDECSVLVGARQLMRRCPTWIVECWPEGLEVAGSSANRLLDLLEHAGLTVHWADGVPISEAAFTEWVMAAHEDPRRYVNLVALR